MVAAVTATLDSFADPQVEALLALLVPALNANLPVSDGTPVVSKAYGWPVDRSRITDTELPLLLVYRSSGTTAFRTIKHKEHQVVFTFEYVHGPIPLDHAAARWPLLQATWHEVERLVSAGHDPAYADDALVLRAAGFVDKLRTPPPTVTFEKAVPGSEIRPAWLATMTLAHRARVDLTALQDFASLDMQFRLVGTDDVLESETDEVLTNDETPEGKNPLVRRILTP